MDINNFWHRPVFLPYLQPDLTDEMVVEVEKELGFKLPQAYIDILKIQNGGTMNYKFPDYDLQPHVSICGIGPNYPNIVNERLPLLDSADFVSFDVEKLLPFDGDGHWYICLDYRNNETEPEITFLDMEVDEEGSARKIADNFEEYISKLCYCQYDDGFGDDFPYVIETDVPIEQVVDIIQNKTGILLKNVSRNPIGSNYSSFNQYRWTSIWTNRVSYGTIGEEKDRYQEFKELLHIPAVRFTELPETALLFSCDDEIEEQSVIAALTPDFSVKHMREYLDIIDVPSNESDDWSIYNVGQPTE